MWSHPLFTFLPIQFGGDSYEGSLGKHTILHLDLHLPRGRGRERARSSADGTAELTPPHAQVLAERPDGPNSKLHCKCATKSAYTTAVSCMRSCRVKCAHLSVTPPRGSNVQRKLRSRICTVTPSGASAMPKESELCRGGAARTHTFGAPPHLERVRGSSESLLAIVLLVLGVS